jgi:aspartyl-tRNA(Asn)/glutamyl-tRNA(Gln) amidotransferase subunit C
MTKITDADIRKLARLSRLKLTEAEIPKYKQEISQIVQFVEQLQQVELGDEQPTSQVTGLVNVTRADALLNYETTAEALLKNAPATEQNQFKVKRMIG